MPLQISIANRIDNIRTGAAPPVDPYSMLYEDLIEMEFEDGVVMDYEN